MANDSERYEGDGETVQCAICSKLSAPAATREACIEKARGWKLLAGGVVICRCCRTRSACSGRPSHSSFSAAVGFWITVFASTSTIDQVVTIRGELRAFVANMPEWGKPELQNARKAIAAGVRDQLAKLQSELKPTRPAAAAAVVQIGAPADLRAAA